MYRFDAVSTSCESGGLPRASDVSVVDSVGGRTRPLFVRCPPFDKRYPPAVRASGMTESLKTRLLRRGFNLFPAYRFSGGKITYVRRDQREIHVKIPLSWRTRNYVGTVFGGSMYAAVDPIYMVMLIRVLGDDFTVWDKAARIRFEKPGRSMLFARCELTDEELEAIRGLEPGENMDREYEIALTDESGTTHATVEKTVYVRRDESASRKPLTAIADYLRR